MGDETVVEDGARRELEGEGTVGGALGDRDGVADAETDIDTVPVGDGDGSARSANAETDIDTVGVGEGEDATFWMANVERTGKRCNWMNANEPRELDVLSEMVLKGKEREWSKEWLGGGWRDRYRCCDDAVPRYADTGIDTICMSELAASLQGKGKTHAASASGLPNNVPPSFPVSSVALSIPSVSLVSSGLVVFNRHYNQKIAQIRITDGAACPRLPPVRTYGAVRPRGWGVMHLVHAPSAQMGREGWGRGSHALPSPFPARTGPRGRSGGASGDVPLMGRVPLRASLPCVQGGTVGRCQGGTPLPRDGKGGAWGRVPLCAPVPRVHGGAAKEGEGEVLGTTARGVPGGVVKGEGEGPVATGRGVACPSPQGTGRGGGDVERHALMRPPSARMGCRWGRREEARRWQALGAADLCVKRVAAVNVGEALHLEGDEERWKERNVAYGREMPEEFCDEDEVRMFSAGTEEHWRAWRHIEASFLPDSQN
ncbi:hypothetical protein EDB86DRAFT_2834839 [Lactarius hatsudake]|nr:hypothetical protein EDB86DRAFT_2834839 [Lactarius hatsudake]